MTFPLWFLFIPYALVLLGTSIFTFFNVYHIVKFGVQSAGTTVLALLYIIGFLTVIALSAWLANGYDWNTTIAFTDIFPFAGGNNANFGL